MKTLYSDESYMLNGWLRYLIVGILLIVAVLILVSYFVDFNADWFHKPTKGLTVALVILMVILALFAMYLKVSVIVDGEAIRLKCISTKVYKKKSIVKAEIITVNPIIDYGGYGYRMKKGERAYIPDNCNTGVHVSFKEGPGIFIASKEPERLLRAING